MAPLLCPSTYSNDGVKLPTQVAVSSANVNKITSGNEVRTPPAGGRSGVDVVGNGSHVSPRKCQLSFKTPDGKRKKFQRYSSM